ncbi:hypothetical protein NRE35_004294 [Salmonella enterica]|nr:hypothetical protein [Salmonella enterica]
MRQIPLRLRHLIKPKPAGEPEREFGNINLLALLFRETKHQLFLTSAKMAGLMIVYLKDPRSQIKQTSKARSSEQSNLKRGLSTPGMTVKNFTKGLRVIRPLHVKFSLTLEFRDGRVEDFVVEYTQDKLFSVFSNKEGCTNYNFLRLLWDQVFERLGFNEDTWKKAVGDYLDDPANGYDDKKNVRSSERSNLRRGLACPNMTIENFTKALRVINPTMATLGMDLKHESGKWTHHSAKLRGSSLASSPFEKEG